jgi:hypothetical protein
VPGYPGDTSPYAALAHIRTASAGDPVIVWDNHGRAYFGSESSDDPAGTPKTFGDQWVAVFDNPGGENGDPMNDGKRFVRSEIVTPTTVVVGQASGIAMRAQAPNAPAPSSSAASNS